ncbi:MAG: glycosyltransferase [Spirulina sp. DLM2.Bin59]|nr:MAG: glycosyltransferase [Spirulina sp. DLM2.Bin59]
MAKISIIIPVRNEATTLPHTLPPLMAEGDLEVIVIDGGSEDETVAIAQTQGAKVHRLPPGRAQQMNYGASLARGEILLFLHGDTQLPPDFAPMVRSLLEKSGVVAGAFQLKIAGEGNALRWVEWWVKVRSHWLQLPYGDQALFIKKARFEQLGGFPPLPIMEDFVFVRRLRGLGRVAIAPQAVTTSPRRWQRLGVFRTTLINQGMILGYYLGISPQRLARWYRGRK